MDNIVEELNVTDPRDRMLLMLVERVGSLETSLYHVKNAIQILNAVSDKNALHSVFPFAITNDDPIGWHSYPGYVDDVPKFLSFIASKLEETFTTLNISFEWDLVLDKIRWHAITINRNLKEEQTKMTYSSMIVFIKKTSKLNSDIVSSIIQTTINNILSKVVPLHNGYHYLLDKMDISDDFAYIVGENISTKYHNEWFQQPIGSQPLIPYIDYESNILHLYEYMNGETKVYKGNSCETGKCGIFISRNRYGNLIDYKSEKYVITDLRM